MKLVIFFSTFAYAGNVTKRAMGCQRLKKKDKAMKTINEEEEETRDEKRSWQSEHPHMCNHIFIAVAARSRA
jgi:hypothetical protein